MLKQLLWTVAILLSLSVSAQASSLGYDPDADPFEQYHAAIDEARATNKLVLLIGGGDWCSWCHRLHRFLKTNPDINTQLEDVFVVVKVYIGDENSNSFFFEQLPRAYGAPHFWVISPDRTVLTSQSTAPLENGKRGYDKERFVQFVQQWSDSKLRVAAR
jgi:hypothetical protein